MNFLKKKKLDWAIAQSSFYTAPPLCTLVLPASAEFSNTVIVLKRDRSVGLGLSEEDKH
jgi:hypothetical protein